MYNQFVISVRCLFSFQQSFIPPFLWGVRVSERRTKKFSAKAARVTAASAQVEKSSDMLVLTENMKALAEQVQAIQKELATNKQKTWRPAYKRQPIHGCSACKQKGELYCRHCWVCGDDNHKSWECPTKNGNTSSSGPSSSTN